MKTTLKKRCSSLAIVLCLAVLSTALLTACGSKTLYLLVTHGDGSEKEFTLVTNADNLGDALLEDEALQALGEVGEFGLLITSVDGEEASDDQRTFWRISRGDAPLKGDIGSLPIVDGESYDLTLSTW